jgi:hypothetical protein
MFAMQILSVMLKRYVKMDKVKTQLDLQRVSSGLAISKEYPTPKGQTLWLWRNIMFLATIAVAFTMIGIKYYPLLKGY